VEPTGNARRWSEFHDAVDMLRGPTPPGCPVYVGHRVWQHLIALAPRDALSALSHEGIRSAEWLLADWAVRDTRSADGLLAFRCDDLPGRDGEQGDDDPAEGSEKAAHSGSIGGEVREGEA